MFITVLFIILRKTGTMVPSLLGVYCMQTGYKLIMLLSGGWAVEDKHLSIWDKHVEINRRLENRRYCTFWLLFKMKKKNIKEGHMLRY